MADRAQCGGRLRSTSRTYADHHDKNQLKMRIVDPCDALTRQILHAFIVPGPNMQMATIISDAIRKPTDVVVETTLTPASAID